MNVERLHALLWDLRAELDSGKSAQRVQRLVDALNKMVQQPQQPDPQQRLSQVRRELQEALSSAESNSFSPARRQNLKDLQVDHLLGEGLREAIEGVLGRNEITPAAAIEELQPIQEELVKLSEAVQQATDGLHNLGIDRDELEPGAFELGVLIPRAAVRNELGQLGAEFLEVRKILLPFVELVTGSRPEIEVRAISSSDFTTILSALPGVAACLSVALERVIATYKNILDIRIKHAQLKEQNVPDSALEGIKEYASDLMAQALEELSQQLREEFGGHMSAPRGNEVQTEILTSLRKIAKRLDNGFSFEVRHEPPEDEEESDDTGAEVSDEDMELERYSEMVTDRLPGLQFINLSGSPILSLPEGDNDDGGSEQV